MFAVLYLWRPLALGFYSDDWPLIVEAAHHGAAFSAERWDAVTAGLPLARPVLLPVMWLLSSLLGASAWAWQSVLVLLTAAGALALRSFLTALVRRLGSDRAYLADVGVAFWLALPWSLGYSAWPAALGGLVSLILFLLAARLLLDPGPGNRRALATAFVLYALSLLAYEAFYFQFLPLLFLVAVVVPLGWRTALALGAGFAAVQAAALGWNRLAASLDPGTAKAFDPDWFSVGSESLRDLFHRMSLAFPVGAEAAALLALAVLVAVVLGYRGAGGGTRLRMVTAVVLAGLAGVVITAFVLALAGYPFLPLGRGSRTFLVLNLWLVVGGAALLVLPEGRWPARSVAALLAVLLVLLGGATLSVGGDWAEIWDRERAIVEDFPAERFAAAGDDAVVLVTGGPSVGPVEVFGDPWTLGPAIVHRYPELRTADGGYRPFLPAKTTEVALWRDGRLVQRSRDGTRPPRIDRPAPELWIWDIPTDRLRRQERPGPVG